MGNVWLEGPDRKVWSEPSLGDMVTLIPQSTEENFTTELTVKLIHRYNRLIGRHFHVQSRILFRHLLPRFGLAMRLTSCLQSNQKEERDDFLRNTIRYRDEGIFRILKILATLVASLLPVAGIAVLFAIQSMPGRIGAIASFTALFSFSLSVITSASTKDIFSSTAAYVDSFLGRMVCKLTKFSALPLY